MTANRKEAVRRWDDRFSCYCSSPPCSGSFFWRVGISYRSGGANTVGDGLVLMELSRLAQERGRCSGTPLTDG